MACPPWSKRGLRDPLLVVFTVINGAFLYTMIIYNDPYRTNDNP